MRSGSTRGRKNGGLGAQQQTSTSTWGAGDGSADSTANIGPVDKATPVPTTAKGPTATPSTEDLAQKRGPPPNTLHNMWKKL